VVNSVNFMFYQNNQNIYKRNLFRDNRGYFSRYYCPIKINKKKFNKINQINISYNTDVGIIRGMHYQKGKYNEMKIVSCIKGKILDVIIDLRKSSKQYLNSYSFILSEKNRKSLIVPKGFAHGFQVLEKNTYVLYLHSELYKKKFDTGLNAFDPVFAIPWKKSIKKKLSKKDKAFKYLSEKKISIGFGF